MPFRAGIWGLPGAIEKGSRKPLYRRDGPPEVIRDHLEGIVSPPAADPR